MKIADQLKLPQLKVALVEAFRRRWCEIVQLTPQFGETMPLNPSKNPVRSFFPHTVTHLKDNLRRGSREAASESGLTISRSASWTRLM